MDDKEALSPEIIEIIDQCFPREGMQPNPDSVRALEEAAHMVLGQSLAALEAWLDDMPYGDAEWETMRPLIPLRVERVLAWDPGRYIRADMRMVSGPNRIAVFTCRVSPATREEPEDIDYNLDWEPLPC